jgi:hypothetical protein
MSSGMNVYSAEQSHILFGQVTDVMELAREGKRPFESVSRSLQAIISDDETVIVPKISVTPTGKIYHITGNSRTAVAAFEALNCPVKWGLADKPAKIPMILQPVDAKVRLAPLGKVMTTEEIYNLPKIASPAQVLAFGAKFQAEQLEGPIVTVWLDALGQFWYLVLYRLDDGRDVRVGQGGLQDEWRGGCRVLLCE